tara:strand:- start:8888 stop:9046 length:159 start_codon:yes stop_codon:yes gene_type:complete
MDNPIDNLIEKTFLLLGTLQAVDTKNPEWCKEFADSLSQQQNATRPFMKTQN